MNIRPIKVEDETVLKESLLKDSYHQGTPLDFFYAPMTACNVYELDDKPVMFVRATKSLRLDIQFVDNKDFKNNRKVLFDGFDKFVEQARQAGFTEITFSSESPLLIAFCKKYFDFEEVHGELRKIIG